MAKTRMVNTRFWSDGFIREKLNPLDRYLYLYFLTNDKTNISGIYELPVSVISSETGIEEKTLKDMLVKFEGKVGYYDGWVILVNFLKYQNIESYTIIKGIEKSLNDAPKHILDYAYSIGYTYGIDTVGIQPEESESESESEREDPLSYEEPPKETFNTKAKTFAKLGIPYRPKKKTSKQEQYLERCKLVDYFKEAVNQEHGKSYFTHPDDIKDIQKENSKISAMMKTFVDRCETIEKSKEVIDWFATGQNKFFEETGYKPQICFRKETVVEFENNKNNKTKTKKEWWQEGIGI